jgi:hypothetical protein
LRTYAAFFRAILLLVDDEGNDLLLNSERGAGGVVVSKEEVAVGIKGSGRAWGSTSQNAGAAGRASPAKWSNTNTGTKSSQAFDRWAVGIDS